MRVKCIKEFTPWYDDGPALGQICVVVEREKGTCDCGGDCYLLEGFGEDMWCAKHFIEIGDMTYNGLMADISYINEPILVSR